MKEPITNRLVQVPEDIRDKFKMIVANDRGFSERVQAMRLRRLVSLAYSRGYQDGYRDGHTDAENGHDERVRAVVS